MFYYKVEYSYRTGIGSERARDYDVYLAENCQEAVDLCRDEFVHLEDMRVERVWKDFGGESYWAVNAWR